MFEKKNCLFFIDLSIYIYILLLFLSSFLFKWLNNKYLFLLIDNLFTLLYIAKIFQISKIYLRHKTLKINGKRRIYLKRWMATSIKVFNKSIYDINFFTNRVLKFKNLQWHCFNCRISQTMSFLCLYILYTKSFEYRKTLFLVSSATYVFCRLFSMVAI